MHSFFGTAGKSFVASSRHAALTAALVASAVALAAPAHATCNGCGGPELWNGWFPPVPNATAFELDFVGDQTGVIPPQVANDPTTNAFASLGASTITVTYDAMANLTRVTYSGQVLPDPVSATWGGPNHQCNGNGTYHFGLNGGWQAQNQNANRFNRIPMSSPVAAYWISNQGTSPVQSLMASWVGKFSKKKGLLWAAVYTEATDCLTGGWQMVAYSPAAQGKAVKIELTNGGPKPITLGATGYIAGISPPNDPDCQKSPQCLANQEVLEQLNDQYFPIPGASGSKFTPVKVPRKAIQPGQSFVFEAK